MATLTLCEGGVHDWDTIEELYIGESIMKRRVRCKICLTQTSEAWLCMGRDKDDELIKKHCESGFNKI